jgi:hypothetical protein
MREQIADGDLARRGHDIVPAALASNGHIRMLERRQMLADGISDQQ